MNPYEQRQQARAERLRARAAKASAEAERLQAQNHALLRIMNGSPILVGHHSEKRHRRDIDKMGRRLHKAVELSAEARDLARRADAVEENEAISSDDPEALPKLRAKLAELEKRRERGVKINAVIRQAKKGGPGWHLPAKDGIRALLIGLVRAEVAKTLAEEYVTADANGDVGIPGYRLRSWASECKRIQGRIVELEKRATAAPVAPVVVGDYSITEEDDRLRVRFPGKPSDEVRTELRRHGFLWSPTAGAWQRRPNYHARVFAEALVQRLAGGAS